jgi:NAD(P)-dependent dehydrogenase (short-subunit alcohol dehydrogenase family)
MIALVTGAYKGIGREISRQLLSKGHTVIVTARNEAKAKEAAAALGENAVACKLDVTSQEDARALAELIRKKFGKLDVLINNAGVLSTAGAAQADIEEARKVMDTNFYGPWQVTLAMLPLLQKSDDARVVNLSSEMGALRQLTGRYAAYRISKHALNALTILLSNELGSSIKVNAMHPGWVRTDMGGAGATRTVEQGADTAVWLATAAEVSSGKFFKDRKEIDW